MQGGAVHSHQLFPLLTGPVRHEDVDGMAGEGTQSGEGDAGVAAGHLHDGLAGLQGAVGGGLGNDVGRQTVLDAAGEVVCLQLCPDKAFPAVQLVADADHGGVPYQMGEVHNVSSSSILIMLNLSILGNTAAQNKRSDVRLHIAPESSSCKTQAR